LIFAGCINPGMSEKEFTVKIILTEDIVALGNMGSVVDVAPGYARNYLIPQGKAMKVTPGNLVQVERAKSKYAEQRASEQQAAEALMERLQGVSLTIAQRVGEEGRLYGSVTPAMIVEALVEQGFELEKKQVDLPEAIKQIGAYEVVIRLAHEVKATVNLEVVAE
jgi:large subunit ribosomal protein L9